MNDFKQLLNEVKAKSIALRKSFEEQYKIGQIFKHKNGKVFVLGHPRQGERLSFIEIALADAPISLIEIIDVEPCNIMDMTPIDSLADGFVLTMAKDIPF